MKKILFVCIGIIVASPSFAQNWVNGGNVLAGSGTIGTNSNNSLLFETAGIERGRITNTGNWGIGSLGTTSKLTINSPVDVPPLRVQIGAITKFFIGANGGVSIGAFNPAPGNGLYVSGITAIGTPGNVMLAPNLQVRQSSANRAILWQHEYLTNYWSVGVGSGTFNSRFEYNGVVKAQISSVDGAYIQVSDLSVKRDVEPLANAMEKIMKLKPSSYFIKNVTNTTNKSIGMIAQEVEEVLPELVYEVDGGLKSLNYAGLSVVAIRALQEQQEKINGLATELQELKELVRELTGQTLTNGKGWMKQNSPNPVKSGTTIQYSTPEDARAARILITNAKGQQLKVYNVLGSGTVQFSVGTLPAGTYVYSLVVDGITVSTKKLVITR